MYRKANLSNIQKKKTCIAFYFEFYYLVFDLPGVARRNITQLLGSSNLETLISFIRN